MLLVSHTKMKTKTIIFLIIFISIRFQTAWAQENINDLDQDGLLDYEEVSIYITSPQHSDTDGDGYADGDEIKNNYDPNKAFDDKLEKIITVNLNDQILSYSLGPYEIKNFKISSGKRYFTTPKGEFNVLNKKPIVNYRGTDYSYPNTKWNMMFKQGSWGNYYIHGAYWHNNFGTPVSHGCVNVSYEYMESLYNWAEVGTKILIK